MASLSQILLSFLGTRAVTVLDSVDQELRGLVIESLIVCADALMELDDFDLTQYELDAIDKEGASLWVEVAPLVDMILTAAASAAEHLTKILPLEELPLEERTEEQELDLDAAFDLMEAGDADELARANHEAAIDNIVERAVEQKQEEMARAMSSLAGMLRQDIATFRGRLGLSQVISDRWLLLAELHELKSACTHCIEAAIAMILSAFSNDQLHLLMPRYTNRTMRALHLRTTITDLSVDIERWNEDLAGAEISVVQDRYVTLVQRMVELAQDSAYGFIRPHDKRSIIQFRHFLIDWSGNPMVLRQEVEGFAKFLQVMLTTINQRPEVIDHDRRNLKMALKLSGTGQSWDVAWPYVQEIYGRSERLDQIIRRYRVTQAFPDEDVAELLAGMLDPLERPGSIDLI